MSVRALAFVVTLLSGGAAPAAEGEPLQPYQMVRSLQLVQDRIADGDHAALPMQRKLLEMIDAKFRSVEASAFDDKRNFRSLLIYAMSGGNPVTIDVVRSRISLEATDKAMIDGVIEYLTGRPKRAADTLEKIDPMAQSADLGSFLALVKGSIAVAEDPDKAIVLFEKAKLLGPGTLVEEAALRRSISLAIERQDVAHFQQWSSQYSRRFLRSPYAAQFADTFVSGVMALNQTIDYAAVDEVVSWMDAEQRKVIYLRLARRGAIEGVAKISEFAAPRAEGGSDPASAEDPRALLYSALANVTSANVSDVLANLSTIDPATLSERDRELLDAVRRVATEMTAPAERAVEPKAAAVAAPAPKVEATVAADANAANAGDEFIPDAEAAVTDTPSEIETKPVPAVRTVEAPTDAPVEPAVAVDAAAAPVADDTVDAAGVTVSDARKALENIDKLLEETTR